MTLQHAAIETHPRDADELVVFFALLGFDEVEPPESLRAARAFATAPGGHSVELMERSP